MNTRDDYLDDLSRRLGNFFDGEDLFDVASVCALMIVFCMSTSPSDIRREAYGKVRKFMDEQFENSIKERES